MIQPDPMAGNLEMLPEVPFLPNGLKDDTVLM